MIVAIWQISDRPLIRKILDGIGAVPDISVNYKSYVGERQAEALMKYQNQGMLNLYREDQSGNLKRYEKHL